MKSHVRGAIPTVKEKPEEVNRQNRENEQRNGSGEAGGGKERKTLKPFF